MATANALHIKDDETVDLVTTVQQLWGLPTGVGAARAIILDHPVVKKLRAKQMKKAARTRRQKGAAA